MTFEEIKKLIQEGKEDEARSHFEGLGQPTPEGVKEYLETEEGKKAIQPILDQYFNKGLETWKGNNLDKIKQQAADEAVKNAYPEETEEQKRLKKLEQELDQERKQRNREVLKNKAVSQATEKGLPIEVIDHFIGEDEDTTLENLSKFEQAMQKVVKSKVDGVFKEGGHDPHKRDKQTGVITREDISKMTPEEINQKWDVISKNMEDGNLK